MLPGPAFSDSWGGPAPIRRGRGLQRASAPGPAAQLRGPVGSGEGPGRTWVKLGQCPSVSVTVSSAAAAQTPTDTVQVNGCGGVPIKLYLHKQAEGQLCPVGSSLSTPGPADLGTLGLPKRGGRGRDTETQSAAQPEGSCLSRTWCARPLGSLSLGWMGNGDQGSHGGTRTRAWPRRRTPGPRGQRALCSPPG